MARIKSLSPTQLTLNALRQEGLICDITEKFIPYGGPINPRTGKRIGVRRDLFGWIDVIVLDPQRGIGGIQSTGQAFRQHIEKLLNSECTEFVIKWLKCRGFVEVWGWRKVKLKRGGKAMQWAPRIREITREDLNIDGLI